MIAALATIFPRFDLPQASTVAGRVDALYDFIFWTSTISFIVIVLGIVVFSYRYSRRRTGEQTPYIEGHAPTEIGVSILLFIWVMVIFYWGWVDYRDMRTMPANALEIHVTARQWTWEFQYANGRKTIDDMAVPRGRKVKLIMTSDDVLHSFFVPDFRIKQDIVPAAYTTLWFEAPAAGAHDVYCAEYCGLDHSGMLAKIRVMEPEEYEQWQHDWELQPLLAMVEGEASASTTAATGTPQALADRGKAVYGERGCPACHSVDGRSGIGPTHWKLFGRADELTDGTKVTVDEQYVRESITDPQAKVVKGFAPVMPTFKGQIGTDDMAAVIEYLKTVQ